MLRFQAIAAMSLNRVIGAGNRIPWRIPDDFRWFKKMTTGHIIIMGRKTFESIGRPLPNRETVILSRSGYRHPGVRTVTSLEDAVDDNETRTAFICGGADVYAQALPLCSDLYLTTVKRVVEGDTFFPVFEDRFVQIADICDEPEFKIAHFRNREMPPK